MNIKKILLAGGQIIFPYMENPEDLIFNATIFFYRDDYDETSKIIVQFPGEETRGGKEFNIDQIIDAIELFERLVFSEKNLFFDKDKIKYIDKGLYFKQ
jgi:hypothetical protein